MALWLWLEGIRGKKHTNEVNDFLKQGFFVLVCVGLTYGIYEMIFIPYINPSIEKFVPTFLIKFFLLPVVLYLAAIIVGPTKDIKIKKAPHPTERKRR
jgi:hypothetical protein